MRASSIATSSASLLLLAVVVVATLSASSADADGRRQVVLRSPRRELHHHHHHRSSSLTGLRRYHHRHNHDENVAVQLLALIPRGGGGEAGGVAIGTSLGEALLLAEKKKKKAAGVVVGVVGGGTTTTTSSAIAARGGDRSKRSGGIGDVKTENGIRINPRAMATLSMAGCMSLHYLAYSLARPATMTLFTSSRLGFGSSKTAYPLAMTFISPLSFVLLLGYGTLLERGGPLYALRTTTCGCAGLLGMSALAISRLDALLGDDNNPSSSLTTLTKYVVGSLFVFRESYVQLITSQHWSFMSSVLTPNQSGSWFAPISGLTSVTSACAALGVGWLSDHWGLQGVLGVAAVALGASALLGGLAYSIAEKNGFNPADEHDRKKQSKKTTMAANNGGGVIKKEESLVAKARDVFARVPTLWALFCEILACQGLSTLLNVCCVTKVSEAIPDDAERAGWMGRFFATINVLSCVLQFGVLPATSSYTEPKVLWRGMPLLMLAMTSSLAFPRLIGGGGGEGGGGGGGDPSLNAVASAFLLMKTLEFSVRRMLDEMVYVPLDYESRFLGKEVIGVLGYRFGKSAASLALSAITSSFGAVGLRDLAYLSTGAAGLWLGTAWRLGGLVPTRAEAEEAYEKMKRDA